MSGIALEVWARLETSLPSGEALTVRAAAPEVTARLQAALDVEGARHLLIRLEPSEAEFRDRESRGLTVQTRELTVVGQPASRFLDIVCQDVGGRAAFDLIGGEIADALAVGTQPPAEVVRRVIAKWRRFWGQLPRQMLSREEQVGLFAELWFLAFWLLPRCGAVQAVNRWRGPHGSRHDFEWTGRSVEVKATTAVGARSHHINGLEQLVPPEAGQLYLFSLQVREEAGATNTLPVLVERCRTLLAGEPEALGRWEGALVTAGYSPVYEDEYAKLHLRIAKETLFAVVDDFPRLVPTSLAAGLPPAVTDVTYSIQPDAFQHLEVGDEELTSTLS